MRLLPTLLSALLIATPSFAHEESRIPENATVLQLQEEASKKVEQDRISATLRIEAENKSPSRLQNEINGQMTKAIAIAKKESSVDVSTGSYSVYEERKSQYNKLREDIWRGSQTLTLDSADKTKILELSTKLQKMGFITNSMNYYLSAEKTKSFRNELMAEAIENIKKRADLVSQQLNLPKVTISELNLTDHTSQPRPQRLHMAKTMAFESAADMAEPAVEGKEQEVKITVRAKVWLED